MHPPLGVAIRLETQTPTRQRVGGRRVGPHPTLNRPRWPTGQNGQRRNAPRKEDGGMVGSGWEDALASCWTALREGQKTHQQGSCLPIEADRGLLCDFLSSCALDAAVVDQSFGNLSFSF